MTLKEKLEEAERLIGMKRNTAIFCREKLTHDETLSEHAQETANNMFTGEVSGLDYALELVGAILDNNNHYFDTIARMTRNDYSNFERGKK